MPRGTISNKKRIVSVFSAFGTGRTVWEMEVPLQVIGSGFGRTGTMSVKLALEFLGLGRCHHMGELFANDWQVPHWRAAARGERVDWEMLMTGFGACVDWPSAHFWRELSEAFPDAKVIHTIRSPEIWWESYSETIMKFISVGEMMPAGVVREMSRWCIEVIGTHTFGSVFTDRQAGIRAFNRRLSEVREAVPKDRLLIFDVSEGWQPLCDILGLTVPDVPFPHANDRSDFWHNFTTGS